MRYRQRPQTDGEVGWADAAPAPMIAAEPWQVLPPGEISRLAHPGVCNAVTYASLACSERIEPPTF
ncbi:hypothetical protein BH20ACT1_BH20ACT1_14840 [soil metagenome]